jgi:hypothetical protein
VISSSLLQLCAGQLVQIHLAFAGGTDATSLLHSFHCEIQVTMGANHMLFFLFFLVFPGFLLAEEGHWKTS